MSKIGKLPIKLSQGVTAEIKNDIVNVTGPKGTISVPLADGVEVKTEGGTLTVFLVEKKNATSAIHGTMRAIIANAVLGVTEGFIRQLEMVGTGYRAEVNGKTLILTIGYSHPVKIEAPDGISFKVEKNMITVEGANKETVGQTAASIRAARPPEPYQGKGIKYVGEIIRRKAGKAAKTVGGAA